MGMEIDTILFSSHDDTVPKFHLSVARWFLSLPRYLHQVLPMYRWKTLHLYVISNEIETIESQKFICPKPDGHYVDPTNCNHYFICIDGVPVSNICPEGLYYDEVNNLCNYPELVNCDATPTTQATK